MVRVPKHNFAFHNKNRRPVVTAPRFERESAQLLLNEVALETGRDGPRISSSRLSRYERDPKRYPLTPAEDERRRAAIRRLTVRAQDVTPSPEDPHMQGVVVP
jgi:hypothetical protein